MMVNNETGAVTDIGGIARMLKKAAPDALLHTDAVQGFLKVPFSAKTLGADMISISGHKIHAPKGVGALYIRSGLRLKPFIVGGSQEDGRRAGTEAMPQICAFGEAARVGAERAADAQKHMAALRERAVERLSREIPGFTVIGGGAPHILSLSLPGYRSEVLMSYLDGQGICVSRSSACKRGARSHVLEAIGLPVVSLTGWQIGMETNATYGAARIIRVSTERLRRELDKRRIVIVAGFQGVDRNEDITTLGRGGSDTTAVAIAAVLRSTPTSRAFTPRTRAKSRTRGSWMK